jgi:hypothetical protein
MDELRLPNKTDHSDHRYPVDHMRKLSEKFAFEAAQVSSSMVGRDYKIQQRHECAQQYLSIDMLSNVLISLFHHATLLTIP